MKLVVFSFCLFSQVSWSSQSISTLKTSISNQELEEARIKSELHKINYNLEKAVRNKTKIDIEISSLNFEIQTLNDQLGESEKAFLMLKTKLAKQAYSLKQGVDLKVLQTLASSQSSAKAEQYSFVLRQLLKNDMNLVTEVKSALNDIDFQKRNLEAKKSQLESSHKKVQIALESLNFENQNKLMKISEARQKLNITKNKLNKLRTQNSDLSFLYGELFFEKKGQLDLPTQGMIKNSYGLRQIEGTNLKTLNRGIFFESIANTTVHSVASGTVVMAENIDHWGPTVVVDHGDHYYSTYSKLDSLKVSYGDKITSKTNIGESKNLYFEVRHFTEPQNPLDWLKGTTSAKN